MFEKVKVKIGSQKRTAQGLSSFIKEEKA